MISSENVPDIPGWIDLGSPDQAASAAFYGAVFGWTAEPAGDEPPNSDYLLLRKDGQIVAGLGGLMDPASASAWIVYMRVPDAGAAMKAVEAAGGAVRVPPMPVDLQGSLAQFTDPGGAEFAVWQPGTTIGAERVCQDDSLLWVELHTGDQAVAERFYGEVFGWKTQPFDGGDEGGGASYTMLTPDLEEQYGQFGGIVPIGLGSPVDEPCWIPYFMVADCDETVAKAVAAGGTVVLPPADSAPGRLAALKDPFGARFSLLKPAPME